MENLASVIRISGIILWRLAPYLLLGVAVASLLVRSRLDRLWRLLEKVPQPFLIPLSALVGTISPLCTLGTIPVITAMMRRGFPVEAAIAFLGGSSMINPQLWALAVGTIGLPLAMAQWVASLITGISAGFAVAGLRLRGIEVGNLRLSVPDRNPHCAKTRHSFGHEFLNQLEHVLPYMLFGAVAAATIDVFLPAQRLEGFLGGRGNPFAVTVGALLSVPFYVCGGGILPVLDTLMQRGLSGGVVLAFLIAGPATRIQAISALAAVVRKRALGLYVAIVLIWAMAAGMLLDRFWTGR